ncbi:MAG: OsmC family protein [Candidatus Thorarchaeota archaeon]
MNDDAVYFPVKLVWKGNKIGEISIDSKIVISTGSPKDEVSANFHSPEDLFVASAAVCYMNGFIEFTKKMRIDFKSFECDATGKLEKVGRSFEVTKIDMLAKVVVASEDVKHKIERALELGAKYCFIGNSMKCPISHETEVVVG